jgi:hypothetical protein
MALGRENVSVARTHGRADVSRLAGFLRDDDLISHNGSFGRIDGAENIRGTAQLRKPHTPSQLYPTNKVTQTYESGVGSSNLSGSANDFNDLGKHDAATLPKNADWEAHGKRQRGFDRVKRAAVNLGARASRSASLLLRSLDCLDLVAERLLQRRQAITIGAMAERYLAERAVKRLKPRRCALCAFTPPGPYRVSLRRSDRSVRRTNRPWRRLTGGGQQRHAQSGVARPSGGVGRRLAG